MPYVYHCESYWPQKFSKPTSQIDAAAIGRWLTEMSAAGWELVSIVKIDDKLRPSEILYHLRREVATT